MCLSQIGKLIYLGLMFGILLFTVAGLTTPHWRDVYIKGNSTEFGHIGLISGCDLPENTCNQWYNTNEPKVDTVIKGLIIFGIILEVFAIGWVFLSCLACCFHSRFMHALAGWSTLIFISLGVAAILFAKNLDSIRDASWPPYVEIKFGYSYFLICASAALAIASGILGAFTAWCSDQPCC